MKNNRGWITWTLSKTGVMVSVLVLMLMLFVMYVYVSCINAADTANRVSEGLSETIMKVSSGPAGIETIYRLPSKVENLPYDLNLTDGGKKGIIVNVYGTRCEKTAGGAPYSARIASVPSPVKNASEENTTLIIRNTGAGVAISKVSACAGCITLAEFNYDAGNDCINLNREYVAFRNDCPGACDLTGWTVRDKIEARPAYVFPATATDSGATITLRTGCGTDTVNDVYWCSTGYPCNAVWNNDGDTLFLRDAAGFLALEYSYPTP
jgi:hypothetical protein